MEYTQEHLIELLDMTNYSIHVNDKDRKCQYVNKQFKKMLENKLLGEKINSIDIIGKRPNEVWEYSEALDRHSCTLEVDNRKIQINTSINKGKRISVETYTLPIYNDQKVIGSIGLSEEAKEGIVLQAIVKPTYKAVQKLTDLMVESNEIKDIDCIIKKIGKQLFRVIKSDYLSIYTYNSEKEEFEKYLEQGLIFKDNHIKIKEKVLNEKFNNKNNLFIEYNIYEKYFEGKQMSLEGKAIDYFGVYPIKGKGKIWGVITIGYTKEHNKPYYRNLYIKELCEKIEWTMRNQFLIEYILKKFEKEKEVESCLSLLFDSAVDCLMILDEKSRVKRINSFWADKLGYTKEEIKGKNVYQFIYKEDREKTRLSLAHKAFKGVNNRYILKDGSLRWMKWQAAQMSLRKRKVILGIGKDIQEEKLAEERRIELRKNLEREKSKNQFFSTLSHEFKTPLNIILSSIQLIKQNLISETGTEVSSNMEKYIHIISRNAYKTLKVANDLIDLIKIDTRSEKLNYNYYNIVEVIEEMTLKVAEYIKKMDKTIIFDTDIEELPVWCDEEIVERILLNLLSNAIKYSPKGGKILVYIKKLPQYVYIWVEDEGINPITEEEEAIDVGKIIWNTQMSGLGLKIADQLISLHGGKMIIEKKSSQGSIIGFTLPIEENNIEKGWVYRDNLEIRHQESCNRELCDI